MVPGSNKLLNSEVLYSQLQYVTPFQGGNYHNNGNIDNSIDFSDSFFNQWATGEKGDNMSNNWGKSLPYFTSLIITRKAWQIAYLFLKMLVHFFLNHNFNDVYCLLCIHQKSEAAKHDI